MQTGINKFNKNLSNLHIIRGLAALYVVVYHSKFFLWSGGSSFIENNPRAEWGLIDYGLFGLDMFSSAGNNMVYLFFLLSGFFISLSIHRSKYSYAQFLTIRGIRIYMPYIFSIIWAVLCFVMAYNINSAVFNENSPFELNKELFNSWNDFNLTTFFKSLFFTKEGNNFLAYNNVYWSLTYEVIFYLLIGFLLSFKTRNIFGILCVLAYLLFYGLGVQTTFIDVNFAYFMFFGIGIFLHYIVEKKPELLERIRLGKYLVLLLTLGFFVAIIGFKLLHKDMLAELSTVVCGVLAVYFFLMFELKKNLLTRFLNFLGEISYSLYLVHIPLFVLGYAIISSLKRTEIWFERSYYWLFSGLAVLIAYPVYLAVEKPSVRINKAIKGKFFTK